MPVQVHIIPGVAENVLWGIRARLASMGMVIQSETVANRGHGETSMVIRAASKDPRTENILPYYLRTMPGIDHVEVQMRTPSALRGSMGGLEDLLKQCGRPITPFCFFGERMLGGCLNEKPHVPHGHGTRFCLGAGGLVGDSILVIAIAEEPVLERGLAKGFSFHIPIDFVCIPPLDPLLERAKPKDLVRRA